jgi:hypothetical protein
MCGRLSLRSLLVGRGFNPTYKKKALERKRFCVLGGLKTRPPKEVRSLVLSIFKVKIMLF